MNKIFKQPIATDTATVQSFSWEGKGSPISVGLDCDDNPCIWYINNEGTAPFTRQIKVCGTGDDAPPSADWWYLGTLKEPPCIWHVFIKRIRE